MSDFERLRSTRVSVVGDRSMTIPMLIRRIKYLKTCMRNTPLGEDHDNQYELWLEECEALTATLLDTLEELMR